MNPKKRRYFNHPTPYLLALLITLLYFSLPIISDWITAKPVYAKYAESDAPGMIRYIQSGLEYPWGKWLGVDWRPFLIFPYWLILFLVLRSIFLHTKDLWKWLGITVLVFFCLIYLFPNTLMVFDNKKPSVSSGRVGQGKIENAKRVDYRGKNFTTYSYLGYLAGRTYTHDKVKQTILDAYEICEATCPDQTFVLGEIGSRKGGRFLPHRTHQNGLSVDFMTPMLKKERPFKRHWVFNIWGYGFEFDEKGKKGKVEIDYETMARHLKALQEAAEKNELTISKVIFDPVLQPLLFEAPSSKGLKRLPFTKRRVIIRHDDHYHVDFKLR